MIFWVSFVVYPRPVSSSAKVGYAETSGRFVGVELIPSKSLPSPTQSIPPMVTIWSIWSMRAVISTGSFPITYFWKRSDSALLIKSGSPAFCRRIS